MAVYCTAVAVTFAVYLFRDVCPVLSFLGVRDHEIDCLNCEFVK